MRKRSLLLLLPLLAFVLVPAVTLTADTVMVYTEDVAGNGDAKLSRGYLEDGVMSVFFDAGHIVFNSFPEAAEGTESPEGFSDRFPVRAAKSGGATLLLEIGMSFNEDKEEPFPVSVDYRFFRIISEELLVNGSVDLNEVRTEEEKEELEKKELVRRLGERVAHDALSGL